MVRWIASAAGFLPAMSARKRLRSMNQPSTLVTAKTLAIDWPFSSSDISPNMLPSASSTTVFSPPPGSVTRASMRPLRIT